MQMGCPDISRAFLRNLYGEHSYLTLAILYRIYLELGRTLVWPCETGATPLVRQTGATPLVRTAPVAVSARALELDPRVYRHLDTL